MENTKFIYKEIRYNDLPMFIVVPYDASEENGMVVKVDEDNSEGGQGGNTGEVLAGAGLLISGGADLITAFGSALNPQANAPDTVIYSNSTNTNTSNVSNSTNTSNVLERKNNILGGVLVGGGVVAVLVILLFLFSGRQQAQKTVIV